MRVYTSGDLIIDLMMGPRPVLSSWKLSPRHTRRVSVHGPSVVVCASSAAEVRVIDTVLQPDVPALNCQNKQRRASYLSSSSLLSRAESS